MTAILILSHLSHRIDRINEAYTSSELTYSSRQSSTNELAIVLDGVRLESSLDFGGRRAKFEVK